MLTLERIKSGLNMFLPGLCRICKENRAFYPALLCADCEELLMNCTFNMNVKTMDYLSAIISCCVYEGVAMECIKLLKFGNEPGALKTFEKMIDNALKENILFENIDLIIPVPMYPSKLRTRGYNQSALLAKNIANLNSARVSGNHLIKTKNTPSQTGLPRTQRIKNLKGSLSVRNTESIKGKNILLVDDVITTGTTMLTCAKQLIRAGAGKVTGFTIARTL